MGGWSLEFSAVFFRTLAGMFAFAAIQALLGKLFEPVVKPIYDLAGSAGTVPRFIAVLGIYSLQFWLTYKILVKVINWYLDKDDQTARQRAQT